MRKIYIIILVSILALFATKITNAQLVDGINYQAVALDENGKEIAGMDIDGNILYEKTIAVRFSIIDASVDGELMYQETHETNTDMYGLFNVIIGHGITTGAATYDTILNVPWGEDKKFLKVELDIENNGTFQLVALQQLLAVPYAFYALNSLAINGHTEVDYSATNEIQIISISNDTIYLSGGGYIELPEDLVDDADNDPLNEIQTLSISGQDLTLSDGGTVTLPDEVDDADADPANELQNISGSVLTGTELTIGIENGTSEMVDLASLQDGTGTDDQGLTAATLTGTMLQIDIEDGTSALVDLAALQDGTGTDDQGLTAATLTGTSLQIDIEDGTSASVDLAGLQDGTGTDDQNLTGASLTGTTLQIDIEDGSSASVDLAGLQDGTGTDDQNISGSGLAGTVLTIGIENGTNETVDLASLQDGTGTDDQNLTSATLTGNTLQINIENGTSASVDLSALDDDTDADADAANELQTLSISGHDITLSDGGGTVTVPDDNTTYSAGNQLTLTGTTFDVTEGTGSDLDADLLDGQHWTDIQTWVNSNDDNTTYTAGTGLTLTGTTFDADFGTAAGTISEGNHTHTNMVDGVGSASHVAYWSDANTITYDASDFYYLAGVDRLYVGTTTGGGQFNMYGQAEISLQNSTSQTATGGALGTIRFTDNHTINTQAEIKAVRGTTGASGDYPSDLVFSTTADGSSTVTERMRIQYDGDIGIGTNSPSYRLHVTDDPGNTRLTFFQNTYDSGSVGDQESLYGYLSSGQIGSGYGPYDTRTPVKGYSFYGYDYTFGVAGYRYNDSYNRGGGVIGGSSSASTPVAWGSLGYRNSAAAHYGAYWTSSGSGAGFMESEGVMSGVGAGGYGELMGGWSRGELMGFTTSGEMYALYNDGNSYTEGFSADIVTSAEGRNAAYSITSTDLKVYDNGEYEINSNEVFVPFDKDFVALISSDKLPTITVSPAGAWAPLYVKEVRNDGFVIANDNSTGNTVKFTWIAVGERIDYKDANLPKDIANEEFSNNLKGFMFNESVTNRNATPMWWDGTKLRYDAIPEKPVDEAAKKAEEEKHFGNN